MYDGKIPQVIDYLKDKIWLNIYTDFVYSVINIFKNLESPGDIFKTYNHFQEACWDINDPIPFIKYGLSIFYFLENR